MIPGQLSVKKGIVWVFASSLISKEKIVLYESTKVPGLSYFVLIGNEVRNQTNQ
jgi:hypothetical protein